MCPQCCPNRSSCLAAFPYFIIVNSHNMSLGSQGDSFLAGVHSIMNQHIYVCTIWSRSIKPSDSFPMLLNCLPSIPTNMQPEVSDRVVVFLAYAHSKTNQHMCAKFGPDRSSRLEPIPDFRIVVVVMLPVDTTMAVMCHVLFCLLHARSWLRMPMRLLHVLPQCRHM